MEEHFGSQGSYLIDFYHVCEYLSAAAKAIAKHAAALDAWMNTQKEALKTGRLDQVRNLRRAGLRGLKLETPPNFSN